MFERFTEGALQVVVLAQEEARTLADAQIGSEHLLLGMLREEHGIAGQTLRALDIAIDQVRVRVAQLAGEDAEVDSDSGWIPFTPHGKRALEMALRETLSLGSYSVGTEHLLLGLARFSDCRATLILADFGAMDRIRPAVLKRLGPGSDRDEIAGSVPRSPSTASAPGSAQNLTYGRHATFFVDMVSRRVRAFRDRHGILPSIRVQLRDGEAFDLIALPEDDEGMVVLQPVGLPRTVVLRESAIARLELHDREPRLNG